MADAAPKLMDVDDFLVWATHQEARYELVEGMPVEMMAGASAVHDAIVVNLISALSAQLGMGPCRPATSDLGVRTKIRGFRRPDVTVTCDPPQGDVYEAREPRLVIEVLSPSNTGVPWERKLNEYRRHAQLDYILLVDAQIVAATLFTRTPAGWDDVDYDQPGDVIELAKLGCRLRLSDVYRGTGLASASL